MYVVMVGAMIVAAAFTLLWAMWVNYWCARWGWDRSALGLFSVIMSPLLIPIGGYVWWILQ